VYNARGVAYLRQHRLARAVSDFEQAIHLDPKLAKYYANRGLVHRDQEKYDLAIADFSKAIELSPSTPDLYDERAETIVFKNDMKQTPASQGDHATAERLRKGKTSTVPLTDVANASTDKSVPAVSRTKSVALLPAPTEAAIKSDPRFAKTDARIRETNAECAEKVEPLETKHKRLASQRKSASRSRSHTGLTRAEKLAQEDDAVMKEIQAIEKERVQKVRRMFNEFCAATGHEPLYIDDGFGRLGDRDEIAATEARRKQRQELARVSGTPRLAADNHIKVLLANGTLRQAVYLKEEIFRPGQRDKLDNALGAAFGTRGRGNAPPQLFDELDPKWKAVYYRVTYVSQAGLLLEKDGYVLTYKKENASVIGPGAMPGSGALWDVEGFHIPGVPE